MALTYCVLGSGSSGNCLWIRGGGVQLLVDCGLSARQVCARLEAVGGRIDEIQGVVVTHGHRDHVMGASVLSRRHGLDIYATRGARRFLPAGIPVERLRALPYPGNLSIGRLQVTSVATPHDSPESVALVVDDGDARLGIVTDLGGVPETMASTLAGVDGLVLEMNHDEQMLANGPYPPRLKRRIRGNYGHLSNLQGGELLRRLAHPGLQSVTLAHISEHNNTPELAREVAERVLAQAPGRAALSIGEHHRPGEPIALRGRGRKQLALPFA
ncbi:MAG: MBL fold metallo-hydrolase [Myxococcales bacterium]|jgi:phosphoribosyl 1,2-cyclic phosphodiesterase